ncbi:MAG TPA: NUDIX hydrolase [Methylophaga aminisulfidivorans]|uniref:NUDIX hydrolase n=1 Tax=Methylophaga aminisulfidivorans TaxID=230105 RepID=A0A7C2AAM1_9GAMM|nr:NUDIX hydrolase [Methylophaga aminisulfidivorans]
MNLDNAINQIDSSIYDANKGLGIKVFELVSRLTPLVNVDLLIKDSKNRTLLAWRDDKFAGKGWHIPGGIVRYKETMEQRIEQVAITEIGHNVDFNPTPITMNEIIRPHSTRGHFISFLYACSIDCDFVPNNSNLTAEDVGYLAWHAQCPDNLIHVHELYRPFIENSQK